MQNLRVYLVALLLLPHVLKSQQTFPVNGIIDERHTTYAFVNAKLFTDYKTFLDRATLLVKDGRILDAGKNVSVPRDAVVYDLHDKYIYPSFIELISDYGLTIEKKSAEKRGPQISSNTKGAYGWNQAVHPETEAVSLFADDEKKAEEWRNAGFGALLSHWRDGIARGTGVMVSAGNGRENDLILKDRAGAFFSYDKGTSTQDYPSSLMGAIALLRQTMLDAKWYKDGGWQKEFNLSLESWNKQLSLPQFFEAKDKYSVLRAARIADEFGFKYIIKGGGDEYQRVDEIKSTGAQVILPVNFPEPYDVSDPYDALNISLREMKHWELAPFNPLRMQQAGIEFSFTASELKERKDFFKNIRKAIECGLSEEQALKACTFSPAAAAGMENELGALKKGMIANFLITSKKLFDKDNVIYENWVQGKRYTVKSEGPKDIRGNYELLISGFKPFPMTVSGEISAPQISLTEDTTKITAQFSFWLNQYSIQFESKRPATKGIIRLTGQLENDSLKTLRGNGQLADGTWISWNTRFLSPLKPDTKKDSLRSDSVAAPGNLWFPNMAFGFEKLPSTETVLIRNATVWTNEKEGILSNTDVLIQNGKISQVGKQLDAAGTPGVVIVDGSGKHLTSGIIDEHSHIAISGDVNECTQAITAEVRIGDVVDADDINIYRQLAGGVTSAHLLHGSCNPVGGQTQLIKLRWGKSPEELKFKNWPGFIKFALGENVKQSNWGDFNTVRYPQTRMGVEQVYMQGFTKAREYERNWKNYNAALKSNPKALRPRKDLELEALDEILNAKRFITCHSYVQSEINMLMHVADSFHFRINTFTHILEGYKVADKMKAHGVGASSFADWWAYKFEVYEAIPHNGAILNKMGVVTAFNSDDPEMARRLNQEAAKAVKYGNVSEEEAWKFVTLNPAKLLRVDDRTGSIRPGKDADLVLWSDNPLSIYARALKTYVDGVCYFDEQADLKKREQIKSERARLVQKMNAEKNKGISTQKPAKTLEIIKHCNEEELHPF